MKRETDMCENKDMEDLKTYINNKMENIYARTQSVAALTATVKELRKMLEVESKRVEIATTHFDRANTKVYDTQMEFNEYKRKCICKDMPSAMALKRGFEYCYDNNINISISKLTALISAMKNE